MEQQVTNWRKSSASANGEQCIEVGGSTAGICVRDTVDRLGPVMAVPATTWAAFLNTLR
jgi:hypothetical protein